MRTLAAFAAVLTLALHAEAGVFDDIILLLRFDVAKHLKLTEAQKKKLLAPRPKGVAPGALINKTLTGAQRKRFNELVLQWHGPMALTFPEISKKFAITQAQSRKMRSIYAAEVKRQMAGTGGVGKTPQERLRLAAIQRKKAQDKMLTVLNPAQLKKWKQMQGKPFAFKR